MADYDNDEDVIKDRQGDDNDGNGKKIKGWVRSRGPRYKVENDRAKPRWERKRNGQKSGNFTLFVDRPFRRADENVQGRKADDDEARDADQPSGGNETTMDKERRTLEGQAQGLAFETISEAQELREHYWQSHGMDPRKPKHKLSMGPGVSRKRGETFPAPRVGLKPGSKNKKILVWQRRDRKKTKLDVDYSSSSEDEQQHDRD